MLGRSHRGRAGRQGATRSRAAIDTLLRSGGAFVSLRRTGWVGASAGCYTSGTAVIEIKRLPDRGYVVMSTSVC